MLAYWALFTIFAIGAVVDSQKAPDMRRPRPVWLFGGLIIALMIGFRYEVGADYQDRFEAEAPGSGRFFAPGAAPDKRMFDLPGFVLWRLEQAGVGEAAWTGHDTRADEALFFSNRRAFLAGEPDFGRMMSAISL